MSESVPQLVYVNDQMDGIRRRRCGRGFTYLDESNQQRIKDQAIRQRINALAIPPAYEDVWVCRLPHGHLQSTGRDAAGRKQYRYHEKWNAYRNQLKFAGLVEFAEALPRLRRRVVRDIDDDELGRRRVVAAAVRMMDLTLIRPGHGGETDGKPTYGLATLRGKHITVTDDHIQLNFRGKSGKQQTRAIASAPVAKVIQRCVGLPGHTLFKYEDSHGQPATIDADDLNQYVQDVTGLEVSSKDFRTWGATVTAAAHLARLGYDPKESVRKKRVVEAIRLTAASLGNRPATCRKYYISPVIPAAYHDDKLDRYMNDRPQPDRLPPRRGLGAEEKAVLKLLKYAGK